ncbi:MAG: beta-fructosidase [Alphaproteobacteria bacterium]
MEITNKKVAQHPSRYVWDFWYSWDCQQEIFHVLYLNADRSLVASDQHHFASELGYAVTKDFVEIDWIDDHAFTARPESWDNTSIWSGDLIAVQGGYLLFYTSRDKVRDDGLTQSIGAAFTTDFRNWTHLETIKIDADPRFYETCGVKGDDTIHAWRDPFLFRIGNTIYMLVAAKVAKAPLGRKGAVGLLRCEDATFSCWEALPPITAPEWYSEMEVPQLYRDCEGLLQLVYSTQSKYDHAPATMGQGGLQALAVSDELQLTATAPKVLLPHTEGLYACRIVPELGGDIVGFDANHGGIRRAFRATGWTAVERDFSDRDIGLPET